MPKQKYSNKVVVYTRVSTEEQGRSGLGIEAQEIVCRVAAAQLGLEIVAQIRDEGMSGTVAPLARPQFNAAIAVAKKHKAKIAIAKLDRLSRNLHHATGFLDGIYDCPEILISENPNASMLELRLKALIAQEERDAISKRTKEALAARKARGAEPNGTVGRQAAAEKAQAATSDAIALAQKLKAEGLSVQKIADRLNALGFKTSRGTDWTQRALAKRLAP